MRALDPDAVEAFLLTADMKSFTRAAHTLNSTQAAVSLKVRRLEQRLGRRLLDRTPRRVQLSRDGEAFIEAAREFVLTHHRAAAAFAPQAVRLSLGITHHLVGPHLPAALNKIRAQDPNVTLDLRIADTRGLLDLLDSGKLDAAIVLRYNENRRSGEQLFTERFCWFASPHLNLRNDDIIPIALQPSPCQIRDMTLKALRTTGRAWREAVVGGGAIAVGAAAVAGLAIAAMARSAAPSGAIDVGRRFQLPALPKRDVVLFTRLKQRASHKVLRSIATAIGSPPPTSA